MKTNFLQSVGNLTNKGMDEFKKKNAQLMQEVVMINVK